MLLHKPKNRYNHSPRNETEGGRMEGRKSPKMGEDGSISFTCDGPSSAFCLFARGVGQGPWPGRPLIPWTHRSVTQQSCVAQPDRLAPEPPAGQASTSRLLSRGGSSPTTRGHHVGSNSSCPSSGGAQRQSPRGWRWLLLIRPVCQPGPVSRLGPRASPRPRDCLSHRSFLPCHTGRQTRAPSFLATTSPLRRIWLQLANK